MGFCGMCPGIEQLGSTASSTKHVQFFKVKYPRLKKWHRSHSTIDLSTHTTIVFHASFAHGMPCVHLSLYATRSLLFVGGGKGTVFLALFTGGFE